jgi:bisphosphoglycerate-independent phosphoglycerate mutase (AlkP superfamily)
VLILPHANEHISLHPGSLADVAPTVISILDIHQPAAMTGKSLVEGLKQVYSSHVLLVILDGWGIGEDAEANPIYLAQTPNWDQFIKLYPHTTWLQESSGSQTWEKW